VSWLENAMDAVEKRHPSSDFAAPLNNNARTTCDDTILTVTTETHKRQQVNFKFSRIRYNALASDALEAKSQIVLDTKIGSFL
jgi:hypothetical protein